MGSCWLVPKETMCKITLLYVVLLVVAISVVNSFPGGHLGVGGVYDSGVYGFGIETIKLAEEAVKISEEMHNEEPLIEENEKRLVRQTGYIPTFSNDANEEDQKFKVEQQASGQRHKETLFRSRR